MTVAECFACELNNMLDEIKRDVFNACSDNYHIPVNTLNCDEIFVIIDKYKAESNERVRMSKEQLKAINDFWKEYTGRELYKNADD